MLVYIPHPLHTNKALRSHKWLDIEKFDIFKSMTNEQAIWSVKNFAPSEARAVTRENMSLYCCKVASGWQDRQTK